MIIRDKYFNFTQRQNVFTSLNSVLQGEPFEGALATYSAGGYVGSLTNNSTASMTLTQVRVLRVDNWLDLRTRALLVEVLTYNAQTGLFTNIIVGLEFFAGGAALSTAQITTLQLDIYSGPSGLAVVILHIVCLVLILTFIVSGIWKMFRQKRGYFMVYST